MKIVFLVYASLWLAALVGYLRYPPPWRPVLAIVAVGTLWYLLPGTVLSIAELVLLAAGAGNPQGCRRGRGRMNQIVHIGQSSG